MVDVNGGMTPMMKQYWEIKSRYPDKDTILFFRLGDFYEMFFEDAEVASGILDIALTSRNKNNDRPVPLCGVPFHSAEGYISKLLANGKKVAICEQVEDPALAKGIVKREVVRVITPGVITEPNNLDAERHNFLAAINHSENTWGFAVIDVSTGFFRAAEFLAVGEIYDEISRLEPSEILISRSISEAGTFSLETRFLSKTTFTVLNDPKFDPSFLERVVGRDSSQKVPDSAKAAAGAICNYIEYTAKEALKHIKCIDVYESGKFMIVDEATKRNLELTRTMIEGGRFGSLLWYLDQTHTPMGARLIREWILHPLQTVETINARLDAVKALFDDVILCDDLSNLLKEIGDIERVSARIAMETANARDIVSLKNSLTTTNKLKEIKIVSGNLLNNILTNIDPLNNLTEQIEKILVDEPPIGTKDGGIIRNGVSNDLDELRKISGEGKGFIAGLEAEERRKTGITSLKVRFNRVFGYYIEVTNTHKEKVPETYIRKQTLANAERFVTPELKAFEEKILGAEEKIKAIEYKIFSDLRFELTRFVPRMKKTAALVAEIDSLLSFAAVARTNRLIRPEVTDSAEIDIKEGRHPIIESINRKDRFIPNDIYLNNDTDRLIIITGPNMAGKSTVMRQAALIVLMAQIGSFVPAASAKIGAVDRIFTRVGASDNIMRGQSTFMVEMQEASAILKEATERSLIIIDEIGRGTSTFDGLALAWAIAEHIHDQIRAKTLFATHYHELTDLTLTKKSAKNFNIAVKEWNDRIIFLHKLMPGGVGHSYGIQVARLAGLPDPIVERSREILANLESGELDEVGQPKLAYSKIDRSKKQIVRDKNQLQLFYQDTHQKFIKELKKTDLNTMSPIDALNFLHKLKSDI